MPPNRPESGALPMAVLVEGALAIVALVLAWIFRVPLREQFPPTGDPLIRALARGVLATLPMLIVFWWLVHSSLPALRRLRRQVEWLMGELFPTSSISQFALIAVLAGVGEELLFRGVLQPLVGRWTTPTAGLLIVSLLFGLTHALSKLYFGLATLIGIYFGWLALRYGDLVAPMVAHTLYDFAALVYLSRAQAHRLDEGGSLSPWDDEPEECDESAPR